MNIFLDDLRNPPAPLNNETWIVIRNSTVFLSTVTYHLEKIKHVAFDHDLGLMSEKNGYECLKAMCDEYWYAAQKGNVLKLPTISCHSANPVGKENIERYYKNCCEQYYHDYPHVTEFGYEPNKRNGVENAGSNPVMGSISI